MRSKISLTLNHSYDINKKQQAQLLIKRPASARQKYPYINKTQLFIKKHKVKYSMPINPKISKGMGKFIEKEELYENTVQLKILVNKLNKELDESKSKIIQQDLELKRKDKLIEDCINDNVTEISMKENLEKGKESNIISLIKEKYYELKKNYKKKCEENEILKANIKITKIKEIQIETQVLQNELEKMKNLYLNGQNLIQNSNIENDNLKEFKNKFGEQHILINSIQKKNEELNQKIKNLNKQINQINENLDKKIKENNKLKVEISKLKISNEKYLNEKKSKEYEIMNKKDKSQKINKIQDELIEYKRLYEQASREIQHFSNLNNNKNKDKENIFIIKSIDKNKYKSIENQNNENEKIKLLKNIIKEYQIKISIYENFLIKNNYSLYSILNNGGYQNGLININSQQIKKKPSEKLEETYKTTFIGENSIPIVSSIENKITGNINYNNENTINNNSNSNTNSKRSNNNNSENNNINNNSNSKNNNSNSNSKNNNSNNSKNNNSNNSNSNSKNNNSNNNSSGKNSNYSNNNEVNENNLNNEFNPIPEVDEEPKNIPHLIKKNLEANNIKIDYLKKEVQKIYNYLESKGEILKEELFKPFTDLLINNMKSSLPNDSDIINNYFDEKLNEFGEEVDKFFEHINMILDNIYDYSNENEKFYLNNIKNSLLNYSDEIINLLNEYDVKKDHIITFRTFNLIMEKLKIEMNDDDLEYLLYKMKKDVPENHSIMDLNYSIIQNLLKNNSNEFLIENNSNLNNSNNKNISYKNNSNSNFIKNNSNLNDSNLNNSNNKSINSLMNNKTNYENEIIKNSLKEVKDKNIKSYNYNIESHLKSKTILNNKSINDIFNKLKNSIKEKNEDFDEIIDKNIIKIDLNNNQLNGIKKEIFLNILKEHDIKIDEELLNQLYEKFKLETNIDYNDELMNVDEIKKWYKK